VRRANGQDEFYSRMMTGEAIEYFVDASGRPTIDYPHVHVIHHGGGTVDVVASRSAGVHVWRTSLMHPSGNQVNVAVSSAQTYLSENDCLDLANPVGGNYSGG
jgi:hypothetical protein